MRSQASGQLSFVVWTLAVSGLVMTGTPKALAQSTAISDGAYQDLTARVTANRASFFVYQDQDSGFNHGFPSGLFGLTDHIAIDSGCVDDSQASNGCSTDPNRLDVTRGTVLRMTFSAMNPDQFAGVNTEEPENWGMSHLGTGYDLRGATALMLDVRSPDGATVQFGVGGCNTPYLSIPGGWTTMTIPLSSLDCAPDLSAVHILLAIATNGAVSPLGGTVLLDNVRFDPVPAQQQTAVSLPVSTQTFGVVSRLDPDPSRPAFPFPTDQVNRNTAAMYEAALTVLAQLRRGQPADLTGARLMLDTVDYALHHENHGDPIPVAPDGSAGVHNGYDNGDLPLFNDQSPPKQGKAGDVRLAGFSAGTDFCGPSAFCLNVDGATGGNNAFGILALIAGYRQFSDVRYLNDARLIGQWIVGNLTDQSGAGYGGYFLGYPDGGVPPPKPLTMSKSIENNADIFAAFMALSRAVTDPAEAALWVTRANVAGDFVMQMFDASNGRFNAGTVLAGTGPGPGVCPTGPQMGNDVINTCDFLDADTFTTLALASTPRYMNQIDWHQPLQYALSTFAKSVSAAGLSYQGVGLVPQPVDGVDGVAWEFTGQIVVTMRFVDALYGETTFEAQAQTYLGNIRQAQVSAPFTDGQGLVAATQQDGDTLVPLFQCIGTPFQCVPERVGLAATTWAIVADVNFNPFTQ